MMSKIDITEKATVNPQKLTDYNEPIEPSFIKLAGEVKAWAESLGSNIKMNSADDMYKYFELQIQNQDLTRQVRELEEALKFYADEPPNSTDTGPWGPNATDFGRRARQTLIRFRNH
jgi:hypothetical protein